MKEFSALEDQFLLLPGSNLYGPNMRAAFSTLGMEVGVRVRVGGRGE